VYSAERKVAMNRKLAPLVAGLLLLALGVTARADVVYDFTTSVAAPLAGPVTASFRVTDAAIGRGAITAADIITYSIDLPSAMSPFESTHYTPSNSMLGPLPPDHVDPTSGAPIIPPEFGFLAAIQRPGQPPGSLQSIFLSL
jgi:hypothetical protein